MHIGIVGELASTDKRATRARHHRTMMMPHSGSRVNSGLPLLNFGGQTDFGWPAQATAFHVS